jgi:hypothetical protein
MAWAQDVVDLYESFAGEFARQLVEMIASLQPDLRALRDAVQQILYSGVGGIVARQREEMTSFVASLEPLPMPTLRELQEAQASLRRHLPRTSDEVKRVEQLSETITADPRHRKVITRMGDTLKHADLSKIPPFALSTLLYWWLCHALSLSLIGEVTSTQASDYLSVVALVLTVLGLLSRS